MLKVHPEMHLLFWDGRRQRPREVLHEDVFVIGNASLHQSLHNCDPLVVQTVKALETSSS